LTKTCIVTLSRLAIKPVINDNLNSAPSSNVTKNTLDIVYQDNDLIIIDKPSGLLTVPGLSSPDNALDRLLEIYPNARVVHRLDMATSGLVIFALNHTAQRNLGKMFEHRKMAKRYTAIVHGRLNSHWGDISAPLICDWENRPRQKVDWHKGKPSITGFRILDYGSERTRLELIPYTGRSHQLRVHMLFMGTPILGDELYGCPASFAAADRLLLHATSLHFNHPITHKALNIESLPAF